MASRTGWPGTVVTDDIITAANLNKLPGGIIAYATGTSDQNNITSTTGLVSVTFTAPGSRLYLVGGGIGLFTQDSSTGTVKVRFFEGLTSFGTIHNESMGSGERASASGTRMHTPSSGSVTYSITIETSAGNVDVSANSTDPGPITLWIADMGPAF